MTSVFSWMDHDEGQRRRMQAGLNQLTEPGTVDELGIGAIRDTIADALFPGTSVLHTRARYLLFIPWLLRMACRKSTVTEAAAELRKLEITLISALLAGGETGGVIGNTAKDKLVRMPSSVYWAALGRLEIRQHDATIQACLRTGVAARRSRRRDPDADEPGDVPGERRDGFDPNLWEPDETLLRSTAFTLTADEQEYLRERITTSPHTAGSLLAHLVRAPGTATALDLAYVWEHPDRDAFPRALRGVVEHGRRFHTVIHGAVLLYNLMLGEQHERGGDHVDKYREQLGQWQAELTRQRPFERWDLDDFWQVLGGRHARIGGPTRQFVDHWLTGIRDGEQPATSDRLRDLVRRREYHLKGSRARLRNPAALAAWTGDSGLRRLDYRWPVARTFIQDLTRPAADGAR